MRLLIAALFAASLYATTIQPGETLLFTAPVVLDNERIRLTLWGPEPGSVSIAYDGTPLRTYTGAGWRTTRIDGVQIRDWVNYVAGLTDYFSGPVGVMAVTNIGAAPWMFDQSSMNFRALNGGSWGMVPTQVAMQGDPVETAHAPEPGTWATALLGVAALALRWTPGAHRQRIAVRSAGAE